MSTGERTTWATAIAAPVGSHSSWRRRAAWTLGIVGIAAYNWWILVPFKPGLMRTPDELFSNLEVTGLPYSALMRQADVAAGVLLTGAFLLAGSPSLAQARREWLCMLTFAIAGAVGGLFPQVCEDGVSASCMSMEWHFRLPLSQYVHDGSGVVEFAAITLALLLALRRTSGQRTVAAWTYRALTGTVLIAYPLLGVAYLLNRLGAVVEAVFFVGFTVMVIAQLAESLRPAGESLPHAAPGVAMR